MLWDTSGSDTLASLTGMYCRGMNGAAVVVDVTDMNCLENARFWKQVVDRSSPQSPLPVPAILLANKCDLVDCRRVSAVALAELAEELNCFAYMEVSAKTDQNVEEAFHMLFDKVLALETLLE